MRLLVYHWNLKYLSALFYANALTFSIVGTGLKDQYSMPGKFMGFSSYGQYDSRLEEWLKENGFFADIWSNKSYFFERLHKDRQVQLQHFGQERMYWMKQGQWN